MKTNRSLNVVAGVLGMILIPVQFVTTFLSGILIVLTFGLFLVVLDVLWHLLCLWPLLATSWLWLRLPLLRLPVLLLGFPHALLAGVYCALAGSGGDIEARRAKMRLIYTWPYSLDYLRIVLGKSVSDTQRQHVAEALINVSV